MLRRHAFALLAFSIAVPGLLAQESGFDRIQTGVHELYELTRPGVVGVQARGGRGASGRGGSGYGAGLVLDVDKKLVLTSEEAVPAAAAEANVRFADHTTVVAKVLARSDELNAVLLEVATMPAVARALPLGESDEVRVGTIVVTLGNPYQSILQTGQTAASLGIVSGIYRAEGNAAYDGDVFELNAAVNPGSYGGPVVDLRGRTIGLVGSTYSHARWLGTAVPIAPVKAWLERIARGEADESTAADERGYLGVELSAGQGGLVVKTIVPGSPAESTELRAGDVLLAAGNRPLAAIKAWEAYLATKRPGDMIRLTVKRGEKTLRLDVVLGSRFM